MSIKILGEEYCCKYCYYASQVCNTAGCCGNPPAQSSQVREKQ